MPLFTRCESSASVENEPCDHTKYSGTTQNELPMISETETADTDGLSENQDEAHDLKITVCKVYVRHNGADCRNTV